MQGEGHSHCFVHFLASKHCLGHFGAPSFTDWGDGVTGLHVSRLLDIRVRSIPAAAWNSGDLTLYSVYKTLFDTIYCQ